MMETQRQVAEPPGKDRVKSREAVSPLNGARLPTTGRPKGTPNRVTRTIREAVEMAAKDCHPKGLAGWLVERAQGSLGDRQIFAAMVNKAMPLQVQANVDGGIRLELGWLAGRQIGTPGTQIPAQQPQALDLQQDSDGLYRIIDPATGAQTAPAAVPAGGQHQAAGADAGQPSQAAQAEPVERPTRRSER
jgi:hypothetical protein